MRIDQVIRAAIPDATADLCEHILWERTPYPFAKLTARDIYRAASRFKRATTNGRRLCDWCDNLAVDGYCCISCAAALKNN